jgi:hypothetical protein
VDSVRLVVKQDLWRGREEEAVVLGAGEKVGARKIGRDLLNQLIAIVEANLKWAHGALEIESPALNGDAVDAID